MRHDIGATRMNAFFRHTNLPATARLMLIFALSCLACVTYAAPAENQNPVVRLETTLGDIDIELYPEKAPESVRNFLERVSEGFYDGLIFHRVIAGFVIQAGGYDHQLTYRPPPETVINESLNRLPNQKYSVAMARLADPDSADTQFFININHNTHLDAAGGQPGYTVFGQVVAGMDVVTAIELVNTHMEGGMAGVPEEDVIITRATRRSGTADN